MAIAIELRHAKRRRDQQEADDESRNRETTHVTCLSARAA
jgi:hypothetical protein